MPCRHTDILLDVGTGTGDIAYTAMQQFPGVRAVGSDFTYEMMAAGVGKMPGLFLPFVQGDTFALPFADNTFDAVVSGFLIRNVVDRVAAFREMARVTKPGGRVACLETAPPTNALLEPALPALLLSHRAADRRHRCRRPPGLLLSAAQHGGVPAARGTGAADGTSGAAQRVLYRAHDGHRGHSHVGTEAQHASRAEWKRLICTANVPRCAATQALSGDAGQNRRLDMILQRGRGRSATTPSCIDASSVDGCGVGMYVQALLPYAQEVAGIDIEPEHLVIAARTVPDAQLEPGGV